MGFYGGWELFYKMDDIVHKKGKPQCLIVEAFQRE